MISPKLHLEELQPTRDLEAPLMSSLKFSFQLTFGDSSSSVWNLLYKKKLPVNFLLKLSSCFQKQHCHAAPDLF